jgi:glycosyltransferase involved in cell wall biosynthesis
VNNSPQLIVILDVAGRILDSEETIERHNIYAQELSVKSNSSLKLLIVTARNRESVTKISRNLHFELVQLPVNRNNFFGFAFRASRTLKARKVAGFVCGDPWESFWISLWLKKAKFINSKIQLQLHGDFGSNLWSKGSLKLKIRQQVVNLNSKSIDSLRFTTKNQQISVNARYKIGCKNQVIVPVPLNLPSLSIAQTNKSRLEIGIVGRIHLERGLDTFIRFAEVAHTQFPEARFKIIGNGREADWFAGELKRRVPVSNLKFTSYLSGDEYFRELGELSLLCSFAPSESYGRAAREALAIGIPVLAVHSAGMDELAESLPHGTVHFLPNYWESEAIIEVLDAALNTKIPAYLLENFKESNQKVISDLIESWIDMVKSE